MESLTSFFYNIIPGGAFLTTIYVLELRNLTKDLNSLPFNFNDASEIIILLVIIISLFIGFVLQAFNKIIKFLLLSSVLRHVEQNDSESYELALSYLKKFKIDKTTDRKKAFFIIHDYLEGVEAGNLPRVFTTLSAFWSNIASGSIIFFIIEFCWKHNLSLSGIFLLIFLFSITLACEYLRTQYDTILKTFSSIKVIKGNLPRRVKG
ncbi:MAG TPA: hypothetical protein VIK81_02545 [Patescibacteria group bacterium]